MWPYNESENEWLDSAPTERARLTVPRPRRARDPGPSGPAQRLYAPGALREDPGRMESPELESPGGDSSTA